MCWKPFLVAAAVAGLSLSSFIAAQSAPAKTFSKAERAEIGDIVKEYLLEHPEVLVDAMNALQAKQDAASKAHVASVLKSRPAAIYNDGFSFVAGNPKAQVTLIEFFDYNCGYCKKAFDKMMALASPNSRVRFIFKEYPILSPDSELAAKAALAAARQGKYLEFHRGLMKHPGRANEESIEAVAKSIGLDLGKLRKDMKDPKIAAQIEATRKVGDDLAIDGTPSFIVGEELLGGWSEDELDELIKGKRS